MGNANNIAELEARLANVEARLGVRELLDRYNDAVNQRDVDAWAACWTDDAVWNIPIMPGQNEVVGKKAIVDSWVRSMKVYPVLIMLAHIGKIELRGEGEAWVRSYHNELGRYVDGREIRPRGQYEDIMVKQNGEWLFKHRTFDAIYGENPEDVKYVD
ncbi:MAG: nuclear transport factor 2 family protein [Sphingomonadaceae bacterium]